MACANEDYTMDDFLLFNKSDFIDEDDSNYSNDVEFLQYNNISQTIDSPAWLGIYKTMTFVVNNVAMPIVFFIGIVGNISNLFILGKKTFRRGLNQIEKSALYGLIVLSTSDLMFCIIGFPS